MRASLVLVLALLAACAAPLKRDRLEPGAGYSQLQKALADEQRVTRQSRLNEEKLLEERAPVPAPAVALAPPRYNPLEETRITISVRAEPLADVLYVIVRNAGMDLVIDPALSLDNRVTVSFENAVSQDVVASLLGAFDVHWETRGNTLVVQRFTERVFHLEFMNTRTGVDIATGGDIFGSASADSTTTNLRSAFQVASSLNRGAEEGSLYGLLAANLRTLLAGPEGAQGTFTLDPVAGTLYVQTTPRRMEAVARLIERLERKLGRMVIIDAQILEVTLAEGFNLGVDWNFVQRRVFGQRVFELGLGSANGTGRTQTGYANVGGPIVFPGSLAPTTDDAYDFIMSATVDALKTFGGVKLISNPHVRARHGLPALVTSGTTMNYVRELTSTRYNDTVTVSTETASAFEGVMLGVVPFLREDGAVDLEIFPITSKVDLTNRATFADQSEVTLPKVDVRNVSTNVRARHGDTIILGGLISRDSTKGDRGVPGLAEVPGLGWLFGRRADSESTRELVVVMHIRVAP